MKWQLTDRGFLPSSDPLERIPDRDFNYVEQLAKDLPDLVDKGRFQEQLGFNALFPRQFSLTEFIECDNEMALERAFMLFSYFASAIIHAKDYRGKVQKSIPVYIARPLVRLAKALRRPPILSYASYCLHNWRRIDKNGPIELGNIELLQNFTSQAKKDEDWFILVHVEIEAKAADALKAMWQTWKHSDIFGLDKALDQIHASLVAMNKTLNRMPECCSPEVYYAKVRPYIFGFDGIVYDGCFDGEPQSFRGETGAQSSIVPSLLTYFRIQHKDSMLTRHLQDMRNYMPRQHTEFIQKLSYSNLRHLVEMDMRYGGQNGLRDRYNACVEQIIKFRQMHFDYAVNYIEKRVENPTGTGGTPYVKWLGQLIEETKTFFFPS